jgi:hypothetical protein
MRVRAVTVAVGLLALAVACGGMGDESRPGYKEVLARHYPPLERALNAAVDPCQRRDLPPCRAHYARALDQTRMLLAALEDADAPQGRELEQADAQFRRGLRALAAVLERTIAAADAGDDDEVAQLHMEQHMVSVDVNNPIGLFNQELGTRLRPH